MTHSKRFVGILVFTTSFTASFIQANAWAQTAPGPVITPYPTAPLIPVAPPSAVSSGPPSMTATPAKRAFHAASTEDWKGQDVSGDYDFGAMMGLGLVDSSGGFYVGATGAIKIIPDGFVPDITNPVFVEAELGPVLGLSAGAFTYAVHLRWDFQKDSQWTFFALGGIAGDSTGANLGSHTEFFPSIGLGTFFRINDQLQLRGEMSHEQMTVGVNWEI